MTEITDRAQELLAGRIDAIRKLSERQRAVTEARKVTDSAERDAATAWTDATQAGWTSTELRKLGLTQPASRRGGRTTGPRTGKQRARESNAEEVAGSSETSE